MLASEARNGLAGRVHFAVRPRSASARKLTGSVSAAFLIHGHGRYTSRGVQGSSDIAVITLCCHSRECGRHVMRCMTVRSMHAH